MELLEAGGPERVTGVASHSINWRDIRVLVVAREKGGGVSPFVKEQAGALERLGLYVQLEGVRGRGFGAYVSMAARIGRIVADRRIDVVHAHFGLCGLAATCQTRVPTVVTFHGTDLNDSRLRVMSRLAARRASARIVVSRELGACAGFSGPTDVIPCGIDLDMFFPEDRIRARRELGFGDEPIVVFASSRDRWVKNFPLADQAVRSLPGVRLVEVRDMSREAVRRLLSAGDVLLMTSHAEGSPQIVKEALATGCPVVSTDVGDVRSLIDGIDGCYIASHDARHVAEKVALVLASGRRVSARKRLEPIDSTAIATRIRAVYERVLNGARASHVSARRAVE